MIGIAVAGALGAMARYGLDELIGRRAGAFPWGIFVVNITGSFLIGFAVAAMEPRFEESWVRAAVVTGFLGASTTFSTFSLDTYRLLEEGHAAQAGRSTHSGPWRSVSSRSGSGSRSAARSRFRGLGAPYYARARASSMIISASARLPKPRVSVLPSSRSL